MQTKNLLTGVMMVLSFISAMAQPGPEMDEKKKEKIERLKRAFISEKLDLTVAESEKFWPVYNEYNNKKTELRKAIKQTDKELKEKNGGEKETLAAIDLITKKRKEEVDLDDKFFRDNLLILGASKVQKLMGVEEEFRRELREELKEKREEKERQGSGEPKKQ